MSSFRTAVDRIAIGRILLGWIACGILLLAGPALQPPLPSAALWLVLAGIVVVIVVCAFGVVVQAEHLARRLGDPYGTVILTLSIVVIEVILICAVMLGPGEHATIARDSVMAASMIVLTLVTGAALLIGGLRGQDLRVNPTGSSTYLSLLVVLVAVAFALPGVLGTGGSYTAAQEVPVIVLTVVLYGFFLVRQAGAQSGDFQEVGEDPASSSEDRTPIGEILRLHRPEIVTRTVLLLATVSPIVVLSHDMASLLDAGLDRLGAPVALSGLLIGLIVFLPEGITTLRAAAAGEGQRMSNLAHGALVSCVGLTLPAVLVIGRLTDQRVILAETPTGLLLLGVSLLLSIVTFSARRPDATHGAVHLVVFVLYVLSILAPA